MDYLQEIDVAAPGFCEFYDELPLWSAPFGLLLLDRVPMKPGLTFLDVGAGTGFLSIELAERCGAFSRVIAVDPWKPAVERLRRKVRQRQLQNIVVLEQKAEDIDIPEASVDVIVSNLGINNFEDPVLVLQTCRRVAKPGAHLLLTTNLVGHMVEFYESFRSVLIEEGHLDRVDTLEAHVNHRATIASVTKLLKGAGFGVVEVATDSFRLRFADGSSLLRHYFIRLGFLPGWKSVAGSLPTGMFEALERKLNHVASERGELALTIPMACFVARKE